MSFSAPSPPPAPDPFAMANAQSSQNRSDARFSQSLNMVDQITPYGSLTYTRRSPNAPDKDQWINDYVAQRIAGDPGYARADSSFQNQHRENLRSEATTLYKQQFPDAQEGYVATVSLTPQQQEILDQQQRITLAGGKLAEDQLGRLKGVLDTPIDFSSVPGLRDGSEQRARVEEAMFGRLNPSLERDRLALETRLRNQGIVPGTEAWTNALRDATMAENDARLGVIAAGGQEQSRDFGQSLATRQQGIQEILTRRNQPINETSALLGLGQVQMPQFVNVPQVNVAPTDVMSGFQMQQAGNLAGFNAANQRSIANLSGLYGLGSSALSAGGFAAGRYFGMPGGAPRGGGQ